MAPIDHTHRGTRSVRDRQGVKHNIPAVLAIRASARSRRRVHAGLIPEALGKKMTDPRHGTPRPHRSCTSPRPRSALDEADGQSPPRHYGMAVPRAAVDTPGPRSRRGALRDCGFPVVAKVVSTDILHKSDAGGVRMNLRTAEEVRDAIRAMAALARDRPARVDGWLIDEMAPPGQEVGVGRLRDPYFGAARHGGPRRNLRRSAPDVAFRICPITHADAEEMLDELKVLRC